MQARIHFISIAIVMTMIIIIVIIIFVIFLVMHFNELKSHVYRFRYIHIRTPVRF